MSVQTDMGAAQFENINALRSYPFVDGTVLVDKTGKTFPQDAIVDVHIVAPCQFPKTEDNFVQPELPHVSLISAHLSKHLISVCFISEFKGKKCALSATVSGSSFEPYTPVRLEKLTGSEDIGGVVTFGNVELPWNHEVYFFDSISVHPECVSIFKSPQLRKIVDIRSGESVSGDVSLTFSRYIQAQKDGSNITLTLEDGADKILASECAKANGYETCGATPIKSINGIRPDSEGNIVLWFH